MSVVQRKPTTTDFYADYRAAQEAGHHSDCDGYRTAHKVELVRNGSLYDAVCEVCGVLPAGHLCSAERARRMGSAHSEEVSCDLRCRKWAA